ncbi:hypothetical protein, partial [Bacteroides thetaiotaomicron]|uniref:hypothetical protein n=1 Tax=Bacteroides thetaiotaomicron TaxID=818 RepID=UPI001A92CE2D
IIHSQQNKIPAHHFRTTTRQRPHWGHAHHGHVKETLRSFAGLGGNGQELRPAFHLVDKRLDLINKAADHALINPEL